MGAVVMANVLHLHSAPSAILDEAVRIAGPGARIVLSWPTSATSNDELARIDFQTGRGWFRTLRADQLRRFVTLLAFGLRVPRASSASVRAHLDAAVAKHSMTMLDDQIAGGCQHVVTLRVAG
jgi:hypothetical protein